MFIIFAENLKMYRERSKLSKAGLARLLNLKYNTYNNYEMGTGEPKLDTLIKMSDILNVSIDELLGKETKNINKEVKAMIDDFLKSNDESDIKTSILDDNHLCVSIPVRNYAQLLSINTKNFSDKINQVNKIIIKEKERLINKAFKDFMTNELIANMPTNITDGDTFWVDDVELTIQEYKEKYPKRFAEWQQYHIDCIKRFQTLLTKLTGKAEEQIKKDNTNYKIIRIKNDTDK